MELFCGWYVLISAYVSCICCHLTCICCRIGEWYNNKYADPEEDPEEVPDFVEKETCTICFEPGCDCITPCGHCFHYECVEPWLATQYTCPNCREDVKVILQYEV
jgi:hypothetical protein